jgi:hypothetical protein
MSTDWAHGRGGEPVDAVETAKAEQFLRRLPEILCGGPSSTPCDPLRLVWLKWGLNKDGWDPVDRSPPPISLEEISRRLGWTETKVREVDHQAIEAMRAQGGDDLGILTEFLFWNVDDAPALHFDRYPDRY